MRELPVQRITDTVKEMCVKANHELSEDMQKALAKAKAFETSPVGQSVLGQLEENLRIAKEEMIPICQDTGMAVFFVQIGQEVHFTGGSLEEAIQEGVRLGYVEGYLRKSVVGDPLIRENTGDNTPAVIHYEIVPGEDVVITFAPKGFGSENMSKVYMLKPADGVEGVKNAILQTVKEAGPNACPPIVVGVGILIDGAEDGVVDDVGSVLSHPVEASVADIGVFVSVAAVGEGACQLRCDGGGVDVILAAGLQ